MEIREGQELPHRRTGDSSTPAKYERNVLYRSGFGDFWFAPKVRVLGETTRLVVGRKYNVTAALQPYLLKKFRRKVGR